MSLSLATATFTGIPDDVVKKIDVYGDLSSELQNSLTSKISAFDTNLNGIISKSLNTVNGIGAEIANRGIDLPTAINRIKDALGGSRSAITEISESLERAILGDLTGIDEGTGYVRRANEMVDSVKLVMDGYDRTFKQDGFTDASGVIRFIRDLSGNQLIDVFDLGAEAALAMGVITEISNWGIPELVDETLGAKRENDIWSYKYDDEFRFSVVKRASDRISPSTNLAVINSLMIHGGDKALVADNPSFPLRLLSGYVLPEGCVQGGPFPVDPDVPFGEQTKTNYAYEGHLLLHILNTLKPNWFYVTRIVKTDDPSQPFKTASVWNLEYLTTASEAAKKVLSTNKDISKAMLSAPFYRIESGISLIKNMYPYFVE